MRSPRVLVTGADGLIGRYAVRLLSSFCSVLAISRRRRGAVEDGVLQVHTDLLNAKAVNDLRGFNADVIVHLAASIPNSLGDEQVALSNQLIDKNVFDLANTLDASVVFCSSVSVYEGRSEPWTESMDLSPRSSYAKSKLISEQLFAQLGSGAVSIRISSPYGVGDPLRKGVLFHFLREALAGHSLTVYGKGARTQDFVHAWDVSNAISRVIRLWERDKGLAKRGVVNIASGSPISMTDLAGLVLQATGNTKPLEFADGQDDEENYRTCICIAQSAQLINWKPEISLADGIDHLLRSLEGKNEDWFIVRRSR